MFKNATAFSMTTTCWPGMAKVRASAFAGKINEDQMKKALKVTKVLIACPEYDKLKEFLRETRQKILVRYVVPSFFKKGIDIVKLSTVADVEKYLADRVEQLPGMIQALIDAYDKAKDEAKERLAKIAEDLLPGAGITFYEESDYPTVDKLRQLFGLRWNWIAFGIPDTLPREVFEAEKARTEKVWQDAQEQITLALRQGFQELIDHMVDRLTTEPGEKQKIFKNTLIENMQEFLETFTNRDINNDAELAALVEKARTVMIGIDPEKLRKDNGTRTTLLTSMTQIKTATDALITEMPSRKYAFELE